MNPEPRIDLLANALADRARSLIVSALMDGRAYTAKELAYRARVSAQTASFHLKHLVEAGVLARHQSGRNRYYYIAGPEIAAAVESLMTVAPVAHLRRHRSRATQEISLARSCYDHLAGKLGVAVADRLSAEGALLSRGGDFGITPRGLQMLRDLGLDLTALEAPQRPLARQCLDWTERRFHMAGVLGTVLLDHFLDDGWLARLADTRALGITAKGASLFHAKLGIDTATLASGSVMDGAAAS